MGYLRLCSSFSLSASNSNLYFMSAVSDFHHEDMILDASAIGCLEPSGSDGTSSSRELRYRIHAFRGRRIFFPVCLSIMGSPSIGSPNSSESEVGVPLGVDMFNYDALSGRLRVGEGVGSMP